MPRCRGAEVPRCRRCRSAGAPGAGAQAITVTAPWDNPGVPRPFVPLAGQGSQAGLYRAGRSALDAWKLERRARSRRLVLVVGPLALVALAGVAYWVAARLGSRRSFRQGRLAPAWRCVLRRRRGPAPVAPQRPEPLGQGRGRRAGHGGLAGAFAREALGGLARSRRAWQPGKR